VNFLPAVDDGSWIGALRYCDEDVFFVVLSILVEGLSHHC
jgi:hypothetical protein